MGPADPGALAAVLVARELFGRFDLHMDRHLDLEAA
jgi:hypothetical protein